MSNLFGLLFILSMIALVIGIINPEKALFFMPKEKQNKKNAILIFGLIFGLIMLISFIGAGITADNTNIVEKEQVKKGKEEKVAKNIDDIIQDKVMEVTGKEDDRIISIDVNDNIGTEVKEDKIALIRINAIENLNQNLTRSGILKENKDIFEKLSEIEEVSEAVILNQYPLVDEYGEVSDEVVLKVGMSKETLNKIKWENFDYDDLENVADEYFENPELISK